MTKKNALIFGIIGLVVIIVIVIAVVMKTSPNAKDEAGYGPGTEAVTRTAAPSNVVVPDAGDKTTGGVAVPTVQVAAAPDVAASFRNFAITIKDNNYSPSTIIVKQGDTVNLMVTAADGNYSFTQPDYGFDVSVKKGATQRVQFQAVNDGKFTFFCRSCGGPAKGPVGYLIVAKP